VCLHRIEVSLCVLFVFFLPTCELVKRACEQHRQYLLNDAFVKMQHTRNLILYLAVGALNRFPKSESIMIMCIFSHDTQCPDNRIRLASQTFFGAITRPSVLRVEITFSKKVAYLLGSIISSGTSITPALAPKATKCKSQAA
jgi:hypothetical protein